MKIDTYWSNETYFFACVIVTHFFVFLYNVSDLKVTIIYPATEKHITKFSAQDIFIFEESPEAYKNITLPHIEKEQFSLDVSFNFYFTVDLLIIFVGKYKNLIRLLG